MSAKKRQQTMAKLRREQSVKERRVRKQQKKDDARIAKAAALNGEPVVDGEDVVDAVGDVGEVA